jgi:predicted DNA-binding protein (MmcQ/YjbR family)
VTQRRKDGAHNKLNLRWVFALICEIPSDPPPKETAADFIGLLGRFPKNLVFNIYQGPITVPLSSPGHLSRDLERRTMTYEKFNKFCRALPSTTYVVQWGGSHVRKVGGKVFAIGGWHDSEPSFTFKVTEISYEMLKEKPGLRPAPYLASRGMTWIQHFAKPGLSGAELRDYIRRSHLIVAQGLAKKKQVELGLIER